MVKAVTADAEIRKVIFEELGAKRLRTIAFDLGIFDSHKLTQDELLGKLARSKLFSTDTALSLLQTKELQKLVKRFELVSVSGSKRAMNDALQDHFADIKSKKRGKSNTQVPKSDQEQIEIPIKKSDDENSFNDRSNDWKALDPLEWVQCPLCPSPVKRCNIEDHLSSVHGVSPDKSGSGIRLTREDIIEAIGREWCVWYMRSALPVGRIDQLTDDEVINKYLSEKSRNLLSLLGKLDSKECEVVADYLDVELEKSDMSTFGRLVKALYERSDRETRLLLQEQALDSDLKGKKKKPSLTKVLIVKSVSGRDPQADFVFCPVCSKEVTAFQLPQHISRIHQELNEFDIRLKRVGKAPSALLVKKGANKKKANRKSSRTENKRQLQKAHPPPGLSPQARKAWFAAKTAEDYAKGRKFKAKTRKKGYVTKKGKPYSAKLPSVRIVSGGLPSLGKRR